MNIDYLYYIILFVSVITYLIGLFLSQFEKKQKVVPLNARNLGYVKTFEMEPLRRKKVVDKEII